MFTISALTFLGLRKNVRINKLGKTIVLSCSVVGAVAWGNDSAEGGDEESVIVTGRHWEENAYLVPETIVLIDTQRLEDDGIELLSAMSPNTVIESSSVQTRIAVRGIVGLDTALFDPVGYYLDGVALPLGGTQLPQLFNLQQVEFIKGPQGAFYGRNSESGVLKLSSRAPTFAPSASAQVRFGSAQGTDSDGQSLVVTARAANALIEDSLAAAIAIRVEESDGPNLNLLDGTDDGAKVESSTGSLAFDWISSEDLKLSWRSHFEDKDLGKARIRRKGGETGTQRFVTNYNSDTFDNFSSSLHSLTVDYTFDDFQLTSITGFTDFSRDFQSDLDAWIFPSPESLFDLSDETFSQEFRLSSAGSGVLQWLLGAYFYDESTEVSFRNGAPPIFRETEIKQQGMAIFAHAEWALSDNLRALLGTRVESIEQEAKQLRVGMLSPTSYGADLDSTKNTPKASLSYLLGDQGLVYISYSEGYMPGGFNYSQANTADSLVFDEEISRSFELGIKQRWLDGRAGIQASLYSIETEDKQVFDLIPGGGLRVANAAQSSSNGFEFAADYAVMDSLIAFAQFGVQETEFDEFVMNAATPTAQDLSGNTLPLASKFTYAFGVRKDSEQGWHGHLSFSGTDDYYFDAANTLEQEGYTRIDAAVGYRWSVFGISVLTRNLSDEEIVSRSLRLPDGTVLVEDTAARYVGFAFDAKL